MIALVAAATAATEPAHIGLDLFLPAPDDLLWSAVVLVIIAVVFFFKIMPAFTGMLDERTAKISGGLQQAEEARIAADQTLQMRQAMLEEARAEASQTREEARAAGLQIVAEHRALATEEAARITEAANRQIEAERDAAELELRSEVGALAADLAGRILGEELASDDAKSRSVDRFLDRLATEQIAGEPGAPEDTDALEDETAALQESGIGESSDPERFGPFRAATLPIKDMGE